MNKKITNSFVFKLAYNFCKCDSMQCESKIAFIKSLTMLFLLCKIYVHSSNGMKYMSMHLNPSIVWQPIITYCKDLMICIF
jgi:hypothetical protein